MLITASAVHNAWSQDTLWNIGSAVGALGLIGWCLAWAYVLAGTIIGQTARRNSSGNTLVGQSPLFRKHQG